MNVGESVGMICKKRNTSGEEYWELIEDKITKVEDTKKHGRRYFTKSKFYPLDADDIDDNTELIEEAIDDGHAFTQEVFGLNDTTRPFIEKWIEWANANRVK